MPGRYRSEIKRSAARELRDLPRTSDRQRIVARIEPLADDPRPAGCTKLSGREAYRVRQGAYRVVYTVADDVLAVEVITVGHRSGVYR